MSGHLIGCVKRITDLPTSHKLALVAFADSGDDRTHIALPGYEGVMEWAGCSRGRAAELIRDLVAWEYLKQHKRGHRGQRAEWIVFPNGCCDLHRKPAAEEPLDQVAAVAAAAGVDEETARRMLGLLEDEKGSGAPDTASVKASSAPDPIGDQEPEQPAEEPPTARKGPDSVQRSGVNADAFTPSTTPPTPTGKPAGARCAAHPDGHANCRACGTTPRQRATAARKAAAEQHRAQQAALTAAERAARDAAAYPPERLESVRAAVRPTRAPARTRPTRRAG